MRAAFLTILLFLSLPLSGYEHFISWDDDVTINEDASVNVEEKITIKTEGIKFKRGMWRAFPTRYTGWLGLQYVVGFDLLRVERDGKQDPYSLVNRINGKQIYIGDPQKRLPPGIHTYFISYKTTRQLGFFENHDELYYNVVGADVAFPIDRVTARVRLPALVPRDKITFEAYTGYTGQKGRNYKAKLLDDGTVFFETTQPLMPLQAFTIVVTWPKGYVTEPSLLMKSWYYLRDNMWLLLLLFGLIILFLFYLRAYRRIRSRIKEGPIVPLFHPPAHVYPGAMRYLIQKGYDARSLTADIVDMAVKGMLAIEYKPGKLFGGTYFLKTKDSPEVSIDNAYYLGIYSILHGRTVELTQSNSNIVQAISKRARREYENSVDKFIQYNHSYSVLGVFISVLFLGVSLLLSYSYIEATILWFVLYVFIIGVLHVYFFRKLPAYTSEGQKLHDEIEGFKLFLATTETDRLKVIGTPPTKTPELWEKYLPYAIALGVEDQWSRQFAPVFARLEQEGRPYTPVWYVGPGPFRPSDAPLFASHIGSSLNSAIASASTPPGTRSGAGGRGGAGGGGGGGGAGGW